jgi:hypothetical protein
LFSIAVLLLLLLLLPLLVDCFVVAVAMLDRLTRLGLLFVYQVHSYIWVDFCGCSIPNYPFCIQSLDVALLIVYCLHSGWVSIAFVA